MKHSQAALIASAVATLLSSAACGSDDSGDKGGEASKQTGALVRCEGINECKGTSECKGEYSSCEGMNECQGMGFISVPAEECAKKGGKNLDEEA